MKPASYFKTVFRYSPKKVLLLMVCMLLAGALEGISYTLFLPLIQAMTARGGAADMTLPYAPFRLSIPAVLGAILVIFAAKGVFAYLQKWYTSKLTLNFEKTLKEDIITSVFESDWKFYMNEKLGSLTNAMSEQSRLASEAFRILTLLSIEAVNIFFYCVVGMIISFPAFLLSVAAGGISFLLLRNFVGRSRVIGTEAAGLKNKMMSHIIEDFSGIKFIKGNRLEDFRGKRTFQMLQDVMKVELKGEKFAAIMEGLPDFVTACVVCLILYTAYYYIRVPGENLLILIMVLYRMNRRLMTFQGYKQRLFLYLPSYDLCRAIVSNARERKESFGAKPFEGLREGLEFDGVSFSYGEHAVLRSVSVKIKKNRLTAIVGRSGSGKTTLVDLVTGLLKTGDGRVLLDGTDLTAYDIFSWRRRIAYVSQDCLLVNGTIEDNIRMENYSAPIEEVTAAAHAAHADEFIRLQPSGYATMVGDRGVRLSGGQRQRIALARALLRKPELLILDEATSALDSESENKVQDAIEALRGKMTLLVIAHRLSTIERADTIYVLSEGLVKESGTMDELRKKSNTFQQLYGLEPLVAGEVS